MFLSFIVPVYNVEKYLPECLDSLLEQDIPHEDYEIICVNDGSPDNSLQILQDYSQRNANIRIISKENGGLAEARNTGLEYAAGEYVWFVDSDDFVQRNCLGALRSLAKQMQCDRISINAYTFRDALSGEERNKAYQGLLVDNTGQYNITVWNNIFRLAHLKKHGLYFHPEVRYAEDGIFMFEFSLFDNVEIKYEKVCYFYRLRSQSLTTANTVEAMKNKIDGDFCVLKYYKQYYLNCQGKPKDIADKLMANLWHLLNIVSQLPAKECREQLRRIRNTGLYPFVRPEACSITKSYTTTRTDIVGKIFDKLYINIHRPWGFWAMRLFHKVRELMKRTGVSK